MFDSDSESDYENEYFKRLDRFKYLYDKHLKQDRIKNYKNYNIHGTSKYINSLSETMLKNLLEIDFECSVDRYIFTDLLEYKENKFIYLKIKTQLYK